MRDFPHDLGFFPRDVGFPPQKWENGISPLIKRSFLTNDFFLK